MISLGFVVGGLLIGTCKQCKCSGFDRGILVNVRRQIVI